MRLLTQGSPGVQRTFNQTHCFFPDACKAKGLERLRKGKQKT